MYLDLFRNNNTGDNNVSVFLAGMPEGQVSGITRGLWSKIIYEIAEITLDPGEYVFGGFVISDQDIQEKITCVLSTGQFTNNTFAVTRHNSGCFDLTERSTVRMSLYFNKATSVPNLIVAPYICKVN